MFVHFVPAYNLYLFWEIWLKIMGTPQNRNLAQIFASLHLRDICGYVLYIYALYILVSYYTYIKI